MRFVLYLLMMIAVALGVGFGLSYYALTDGRFFGVAQVGPWHAWPDVGSSAPNPYTRAHLARTAAFELGQAEGLQFTATSDSDGEALTRDCSYSIVGMTPLASFWTLVAQDEAGINVAAPDVAPSLRSTDVTRDNDGALHIHVGTRLAPGTWLELTGSGPFQLVLRLYDTAAFSGLSSDQAMPAINRGDCV
ncbi:MAG: DUF1214 domain-containing protein [Candidatus Devosia phytovorans]|uniref:DUF1214 domain-containing protein n=1 Tax=Candidatus Devosia phytovorans TaxID=3121372 RepID=A0AAJ5VSD8_9HYPH|nr:DUF1214 domain-containing protein [Devosia sp.]WEK02807.1 MAG: DUF1214 domain-containing protein [Devosia sp.]